MTEPAFVVTGFDGAAATQRALEERERRRVATPTTRAPRQKPARRKLSFQLARQIRRLRDRYGWTHDELAELFSVRRRTIGYVLAGKLYDERRAPMDLERAS